MPVEVVVTPPLQSGEILPLLLLYVCNTGTTEKAAFSIEAMLKLKVSFSLDVLSKCHPWCPELEELDQFKE